MGDSGGTLAEGGGREEEHQNGGIGGVRRGKGTRKGTLGVRIWNGEGTEKGAVRWGVEEDCRNQNGGTGVGRVLQ